MDKDTKQEVRRALRDNPDLPVRFVIAAIRAQQEVHLSSKYKRGAR